MNVVKSELIFRRWRYPISYDSRDEAVDVKEEEVPPVMFTRHAVGLYWVPGHAGVWGNEMANELARDGSVQRFVGPQFSLGTSRQNIRRKIKLWMDNQQLVLWRSPCSTQRQARLLISDPKLAKWSWLLSFNRTQFKAVVGLLTGHNTLRRHLYVMALSKNLICRKCGTEEETSIPHVVCVWGLCFS